MAAQLDSSARASTKVYLQEACLRHQFIRSKDTSNIVERPQRLRAINVGISAVLARLENAQPSSDAESYHDQLVNALNRINLNNHSSQVPERPLEIVKSSETVDILHHRAVKFVHGDVDGDVYLEKLIKWTKESRQKIADDGCEIPPGLPKGDLYLCPTSLEAIQGALGTVCEAVDHLCSPSASHSRAFVAVRPPGHHCGEDTPSGFCFVNNVVVGAAHAHLQHGINRAVIFDIDLHHGNGTQSLIWQINEESYRLKLEEEFRVSSESNEKPKQGLQIFYGSLHDVLSYPCEDGNPTLIQAASVSIHGPHGQYVENIHLLPYQSEDEFWTELYEKQYSALFTRAKSFIEQTANGDPNDVLVFISCGFDASEHEYPSMSRHARHVPTSFYRRFARDALRFAEAHSGGRLLSVLEGGYSDRALTSGVMSWLAGLAEGPNQSVPVDESWWKVENLVALEKAIKKRRGGRNSVSPAEPWLQRTQEIFASIDTAPKHATPVSVVPPLRMALRDRTRPGSAKPEIKKEAVEVQLSDSSFATSESSSDEEENQPPPLGNNPPLRAPSPAKRLPRVVLKLGPRPET
ncbi:hypothetical protein NM688_g627 [Phlebia brevispora]|uniref:Uncharacterized protein n=1 Tax=Phlebia brevispora TaxID=194682 RepID=A0ACC1TDK9_9APHY|nr:hypothetical protein NM688_g627 [Phlebia brevispora]